MLGLGIANMSCAKALIVADECNRDDPEWTYEAEIINEVEDTACVKITTDDGEVFYM